MSREYVVCIDNTPSGWVTLQFPTGTVVMGLQLGHRYLATDPVVQQHPHRFRPVTPTEKAA